ncbi:hypothetical protein BDN71DRAFT_524220 [Pleurotus eryngii]|uniref:Uncharacterized protein n=1 Tax=Pleurotus eryngii TaxID=5323 RepID=A0A9P6DA11_PLEER|nr:hypothetical protein BDN71DRAFT_524220 [Pleurotus eryngii]
MTIHLYAVLVYSVLEMGLAARRCYFFTMFSAYFVQPTRNASHAMVAILIINGRQYQLAALSHSSTYQGSAWHSAVPKIHPLSQVRRLEPEGGFYEETYHFWDTSHIDLGFGNAGQTVIVVLQTYSIRALCRSETTDPYGLNHVLLTWPDPGQHVD